MKNVIQLVSQSNSLSVEGMHSLNPKVELGEKVLGRHRVSFKVAVVNDELWKSPGGVALAERIENISIGFEFFLGAI